MSLSFGAGHFRPIRPLPNAFVSHNALLRHEQAQGHIAIIYTGEERTGPPEPGDGEIEAINSFTPQADALVRAGLAGTQHREVPLTQYYGDLYVRRFEETRRRLQETHPDLPLRRLQEQLRARTGANSLEQARKNGVKVAEMLLCQANKTSLNDHLEALPDMSPLSGPKHTAHPFTIYV